MELLGRVNGGVVVPQGEASLPEGATVRIVYEPPPSEPVDEMTADQAYRVEFPLVHSKYPGSVNLTNRRIQEILDEDDLSAGR